MKTFPRLRLVIGVAAFIGVIVALMVGQVVATRVADDRYFNTLSANMDQAAVVIAKDSPWKVDVDKKTFCANSEQDAWGNGRLWCHVAQAYYANINNPSEAMPAAQELVNRAGAAFKAVGFTTGSISAPLWVYTTLRLDKTGGQIRDGKGVCSFSLDYPANEFTPYYLRQRGNLTKKVQLTVSCGARSSVKTFAAPPKLGT